MDISDQVLIVQNPDGTIQIATQPHLKNKKVMDCYQCKTKIVFESQFTTLKCGKCGTINQVPGTKSKPLIPSTVACVLCRGQAKVIQYNDMYLAQCERCGAVAGLY